MQAMRTISVGAMLAVLGAFTAQAQSLRSGSEPEEFPPASFKSSQYVDSKGCIYLRSGSGSLTDWVPRVSRDGRLLCGFKPSLASLEAELPVIPDPEPTVTVAEAAPSVPAPQAAPTSQPAATRPAGTGASVLAGLFAPKPTEIRDVTVAAAAPAKVATPAPQPQVPPISSYAGKSVGERGCVADSAGRVNCGGQAQYILKRLPVGVTYTDATGRRVKTTEPTLVRVPVKTQRKVPTPVQMPEPVMVASAAPNLVQVPAPQTQRVTNCAALGAATAAYMQTDGRHEVRCGPQAVHPSEFLQRQQGVRLSAMNQARGAAARVASAQHLPVHAPHQVTVPKGYHKAWDDGRLNPNRGPRTMQGDIQQAQVWSKTTPAYGIGYPRKRTFWEWLLGDMRDVGKKTVIVTQQNTKKSGLRLSAKSAAPVQTPTGTAPRIQSASADPAPSLKAAPVGLRYVQVGSFGDPANAARSIARLSAMGFPVSSQTSTGSGRTLKIVLAGPFAQSEQTLSALGTVRAAGFGDAFARK